MKLEQMDVGEVQKYMNISNSEFLLMIMKRLERIESKLDSNLDDAIKERLKLK